VEAESKAVEKKKEQERAEMARQQAERKEAARYEAAEARKVDRMKQFAAGKLPAEELNNQELIKKLKELDVPSKEHAGMNKAALVGLLKTKLAESATKKRALVGTSAESALPEKKKKDGFCNCGEKISRGVGLIFRPRSLHGCRSLNNRLYCHYQHA